MTIMTTPSVQVCMAPLYGGPGHVCVYESLELRGGFGCVWGSRARAYREVGSAGGMEVVGGCKHHHDQAEGEDSLHAPGLAIVDVLRQLVGAPADGCEGVGIDLRSTASNITVHLRYAAGMRGRHGRDDAPESQPMSCASSHAPFRTHLSRLPWQQLGLTVP